MPSARSLALFVLLVFAASLGGVPRAARAEDALKSIKEKILRTLEDKDVARRAGALRPLEQAKDPLALEIAVEAAKKIRGMIAKVRGDQLKQELAYEKAINDGNELDRAFQEKNDNSVRATDAYNKSERKFSNERDSALEALRELEVEFVRVKALLDSVSISAGKLFATLDPAQVPVGLDLLEKAWLRSPERGDAARYVDSVGGITLEIARERIRRIVADATLTPQVRAIALANLAAARDATLPAAVLAYLSLNRDSFALVRATISALARVHKRECIEPLITFLGREDIGVLRGDARSALRSLTGQKHGPFRGPWEDWWSKNQATFVMPPDPTEEDAVDEEDKGVTFYGVTTFSDRILFLLDISGSMDKAGSKDKPQPDRLTVAKQELLGAISRVDDKHRFDVMVFNHQVIPWQPAMVVASEEQRRKVKTWVQELFPMGGTNIHDALETGFALASSTTGAPAADTIFFMTDGTPTAGKLQTPAAILEAVKDWNRGTNLTIHCIAVGEADQDFLKALAKIGHGQFIHR